MIIPSRTSRKSGLAIAFLLTMAASMFAADVIKVFILAGQSNMEGKVQSKLMDHQASDPKTKDLFKHWRKDDDWIVRDDVWIKFLGKHGGLTKGYGSGDRTGVELEFGNVVGNHFDEPVLLIKAAWGGHSLVKNFRPPSAGLPDESFLKDELEKAQKRVTNSNEKRNRNEALPIMDDIKSAYGLSYRNMLGEVKDTFENYEKLFPSLKGKTLEIAGFVWFQGWNDQYNGAEKAYGANMEQFIENVRTDLKSPGLPFVIGVMGQNGSKPAKGAMLTIQEAQLAMETMPKFSSNVKAVRTDVLIDKVAEKLYPTWKQNIAEWEKTGSDHGYHYLGSAIWHLRMGDAFAKAMIDLLPSK
jgi:hypothetical protein